MLLLLHNILQYIIIGKYCNIAINIAGTTYIAINIAGTPNIAINIDPNCNIAVNIGDEKYFQ